MTQSSGWEIPYFDRDGNRISIDRYVELLRDPDYRRLTSDDVLTEDGRTMWVSTVWLGLDHGIGRGKPLIFETMVFVEGMAGDYCERYSSVREARAGHDHVVRQLHAGVAVEDLGPLVGGPL